MAFNKNFGVGTPPRKPGAPPPLFGGEKPKPKAAVAIAIKPAVAADDESLDTEPAGKPQAAGEGVIPPEAVCYRSAMETCGGCEYNSAGDCSKLHIPVSDGDGCNLFSGRDGGDADDAADKFEDEGAEAMEAPE